jgi:hypothetical protein
MRAPNLLHLCTYTSMLALPQAVECSREPCTRKEYSPWLSSNITVVETVGESELGPLALFDARGQGHWKLPRLSPSCPPCSVEFSSRLKTEVSSGDVAKSHV